MRLFLAALALTAACGSTGHGRSAPGGAGAGGAAGNSPFDGTGGVIFVQPDLDGATFDAGADVEAELPDAELPSSCQIAGDGGSACLELDPGTADPDSVCGANGGGPAISAACPRDGSTGGCHVAISGRSGYTIWSYAPVTSTAVLLQCARMGDTYVSP